MEKNEEDSIIAFDTLYTTNQLQMLKILFPYLQPDMQSHIAIYIKFSELLVTLHFSQESTPNSPIFHKKRNLDFPTLSKELSPYLSREEKDMLKKMSEMMDTMENFQQISQMMQMMDDTDSPESMLQGFLSEEQMAMFKMFQEDLS